MREKIKIDLSDPGVRAVWETALEARREVASWPAWKRGELVPEAPVYVRPFRIVDRLPPRAPLPEGMTIEVWTCWPELRYCSRGGCSSCAPPPPMTRRLEIA